MECLIRNKGFNFLFANLLGATIGRTFDTLLILDRKSEAISDAIFAEGVAA